jgi:hypothetical protein
VQIDARRSWRITRSQPSILGEFRWTGFDCIGESGGWPRVLGNDGIIGLCNFPKNNYCFYQSQWTDKPMVHLLPHWTWPGKEGVTIPVWCYTNCDEAELFLNGASLGTRRFDEKKRHASRMAGALSARRLRRRRPAQPHGISSQHLPQHQRTRPRPRPIPLWMEWTACRR